MNTMNLIEMIAANMFRKTGETKKLSVPGQVNYICDRGTQYTAFTFRKFLDKHNVIQSFSKLAHPWDNAVAESFFK